MKFGTILAKGKQRYFVQSQNEDPLSGVFFLSGYHGIIAYLTLVYQNLQLFLHLLWRQTIFTNWGAFYHFVSKTLDGVVATMTLLITNFRCGLAM